MHFYHYILCEMLGMGINIMQNTEVLATVENREITKKDLDTLINSLDPQTAMQFRSEEGKKSILTELVNQELLYLDAKSNELDKDEEYTKEVEKAKITILKQFAMSKLLNQLTVSENEVVNYYIANKDNFAASASIKASHILVDTKEKCSEIEKEIKEGLSFEDAAKQHSSCPSKDMGGDLGNFSRGMMVPEFEEAAFGLSIGQMSPPVKTQFGYHLIKLVEKTEGTIKPIDEVKEQIANMLLAKKQQEVYLDKIKELSGKYEVKLNV